MYGTPPSEASIGRTFVRNIDGREINVHLSLRDLEIGNDFVREMATLPSLMGLVGELIADVTDAYQTADAEYRQWRGRQVGAVLAADAKLAEWKVKADVDADEEFAEHKRTIAGYEGDLEFLRGFQESLRAKSLMLNARVNMLRGTPSGDVPTYGADDAPAPRRAPAPPKPEQPDPDEKRRANKDRVRAAMSRTPREDD